MSKQYRPWSPDQSFLLPPSPRDWLPKAHLAYFVLDVVEELDLSAVEGAIQEKDPRGTRPYDPRMMTALLLYGYCVGVPSSRRIERATHEDVAFRVIAAGQHPDHASISEFRRRHLKALMGLFGQVLVLCQRAGLVKLGHVSLDGTKLQANASKHKAMSYARMLKSEKELEAEVARLLEEAEHVDQEEDRRYGVGVRGDELPEELARRESRLKRIREVKAALEAEAREARAAQEAEKARRKAESAPESSADAESSDAPSPEDPVGVEAEPAPPPRAEWPKHRVPTTRDGAPKPEAQRNFTDPDSRIQKVGTGFLQGYNAQAAVDDGGHQIIVGAGVTNQSPDAEHLLPVLDAVKDNLGSYPEKATADNGYWSTENVAGCVARGIDVYIAVGRHKHGASGVRAPEPVATEGQSPPARTPAEQARASMRSKLSTEEGRALYARRKTLPEPVFGQIKQARGFRRLWMRGLEKVRAEWALICTTHNLLKLFGAVRSGSPRLAAAADGPNA